MNTYSLESFISFCDDMQISNESFNFKSIKAKIVKAFSKLIDLIENKVKKMKDSSIKVNLMKLLSRAKAGLGKSKSLNESDPEKAKELQKEAEELKKKYTDIILTNDPNHKDETFISEFTINEFTIWFHRNLKSSGYKGVARIIKDKNLVILYAHDRTNDKVTASAKIRFTKLDKELQDLFDKHNGTIVINK